MNTASARPRPRLVTHGRVVADSAPLHGHAPCCRPASPSRGRRRRGCCGAATSAGDHPPPPPPLSPASFPALAHPSVAHFLNLTNGLEAAPILHQLHLPFTLVRIQSTVCEQQRFDALVSGADAALLAAAALGRTCLVWDFGSRGETGGPPRALWYGLEFLAWAASRKWFPGARGEARRRAHLKGHDVSAVFEAAVRGGRGWGHDLLSSSSGESGSEPSPPAGAALPRGFDPARSGVSKASLVRLRYFRRFVPVDAPPSTHVRLWGAHRPTGRDGDAEWYTALAAAECGPHGRGGGAGGAGVALPPPPSSPVVVTGPDGRVDADALAADLARLGGFGLFTGGVPHDKGGGVPPAVVAARARRRRSEET